MAAQGKPDRAGGSVDLSGYLTVLLFWAVFLPQFAFAQTTSEKENQFVKLVKAGENAPAHALLDDLLQEDSAGLYRLVVPVEQLILPGEGLRGEPGTDQIMQLFRLYDLGSRHDPSGPGAWHIRKALLALRYPKLFDQQTGKLLRTAVTEVPLDCPLLLYEEWAKWEITNWVASNEKSPNRANTSLDPIVPAWRQISELLYLRQIENSAETEDAGRLQQHLALKMRDVLPDCAGLSRVFSTTPKARDCADFLIVHELQQCDLDPGLWTSAFECATAEAPAAWMYRLAAHRSFSARDYLTAKQHQARAESLENNLSLKAADLLSQAEINALLKDYPAARNNIRRAMEIFPNWGEPYFSLCDLYLQSVPTCKFSAFDQKAIYWLAIDLCQTALNADPGCEREAADRIYRYKQLDPTAAEVAFKGLKAGDTWPLRCWMNTVTTVKVD